jgi:hypothetical protein
MYRIIGADGKEYGPISAEQLRQWIAEGRVNAQTRVLAEGATEWKTIAETPEFAAAVPSPGAFAFRNSRDAFRRFGHSLGPGQRTGHRIDHYRGY